MNHRGRTTFIIAFLAPAALLYGVFVVYPLANAFNMSLYRWRGVSEHKTFVGTENFNKLFHDDVFWKALKHNLWLLAVGMVLIFLVGLLLAHAMQGGGRMARALRNVVLFPQVISLVAVAILWMFMFNPSYGLVTQSIKKTVLPDWDGNVLGSPSLALPAVGIAFLWYAIGFYIMLFSTGLRGIP